MKYILLFTFIIILGYLIIAFPTQKTLTEEMPVIDTKISTKTLTENISLEEKIGQMLIIGFRGTTVSKDSSIIKIINDLYIGGIILFDYDLPSHNSIRNIVSEKQTRALISDIKKLSNENIFVSVDLEGGVVNRLKKFSSFPSAKDIGNKNDLAYTEKTAENIGRELSDLGFNMDFAPVVDVNINPKNPIIGALGRSFSNDPEQVTLQAEAFIKGLHTAGIVSVIKHFPGHGSSSTDSHLGLVDITNTYKDTELIPYQKLATVAEAVMVAHVTNQKIDQDYPATLSPLFIEKILREQINFNGVVISDDMSMGAIIKNYTFKDAIIRAINAGNNILIISNNGSDPYDENLIYEASKIINNAVTTGEIPIEKIDSSYEKIQKLKKILI